jgi:ABC-type branched-subunit amino acid transport system permease subunit
MTTFKMNINTKVAIVFGVICAWAQYFIDVVSGIEPKMAKLFIAGAIGGAGSVIGKALGELLIKAIKAVFLSLKHKHSSKIKNR